MQHIIAGWRIIFAVFAIFANLLSGITIAALFRSLAFRAKTYMENSTPQTLIELLKQATAAYSQKEVLKSKQGKEWVGITGQQLLERTDYRVGGLQQKNS